MALTSANTFTDAVNQWRDNAAWAAEGSTAKAKLFSEAVRFLLSLPEDATAPGLTVKLDHDRMLEQAKEAEEFARARDETLRAGPDRTLADFRRWRR